MIPLGGCGKNSFLEKYCIKKQLFICVFAIENDFAAGSIALSLSYVLPLLVYPLRRERHAGRIVLHKPKAIDILIE